MVKIRLKRLGAKKHPVYRVVVAESTSPRDGRFIETIGFYNPGVHPREVRLDVERARYWLEHGAQPTDTAANLLMSNGVAVRGHVKPARQENEKFAATPQTQNSVESSAPVASEPVVTEESTVVASEPVATESTAATDGVPETANS